MSKFELLNQLLMRSKAKKAAVDECRGLLRIIGVKRIEELSAELQLGEMMGDWTFLFVRRLLTMIFENI